ncbi:MAG: beta-ketoacyl-ACP synthase II [Chloroflexi bacterium]|nr:beta-ketoacyl-ACP synthase II [Chloroflexota bacterium]
MSTNGHHDGRDEQRVVITGMGAVTPLGFTVDTLWQNLLAGKSAARHIDRFDASGFAVQICSDIADNTFNIEEHSRALDKKEARRLDPFEQYAVVTTEQALAQAGLQIDDSNRDEIGVLIGTGLGGLIVIDNGYKALNEKGPMRVNPFTGALMLPNMGGGQVAITFGARGPNFCVVSACATGSNALGEAYEIIRRGDALAMITGAAETVMTPFALAAFHRTQAMSTRNDDPQHASRPFDAKRDGFVYGNGAGLMIFERLDFAKQRGAPILAEVVGYGATDDAYHISAPAPDGGGARRALQRALDKAHLKPEQIDYINAHGTSTVLNDAAETAAIKAVFGEYAYGVPISSSKSMLGHLMGAAGAVEAVITVKTMLEGWIHPTVNYEYPDPDCDLDYVPNTPRQKQVNIAMSNSFGFGGHNACLIFQKWAN